MELSELKKIISSHYPHPVFGCECVMKDTDEDGRVKNPVRSWEEHLAQVILENQDTQENVLSEMVKGHGWHAHSRIPGLNYCQHEEHSEKTNGSSVCWKAQAAESIRVDERVMREAGNSEAASAEGG